MNASRAVPELKFNLGMQRHILALSMGLFIASGFAALIYQSVWSTYLGLILGHAAYAQALVLSIFMGGMAIGSWLTSRIRRDTVELIKLYGFLEIGIGLLGLAFHSEYLMVSSFSHATALPAMPSASAAIAWQWLSGAALVLPQAILLGTTFPILGAACIRASTRSDSSVLGSLYFANSIGAAFGALIATFLLVPEFGTPGSLVASGLINICVGVVAIVYARNLGRRDREMDVPPAAPKDTSSQPQPTAPTMSEMSTPTAIPGLSRMMMIAALLTGATSFIYEIGWVRLLNLSMGSTQHSFELMLSSFILGLALGGLLVRYWAQRPNFDVVRGAAFAQAAMGVATLVCLILYAYSFSLVEWVMAAVTRSDAGYRIFLSATAFASLLTVFPAAFFAGMTLPLMTAALIRSGAGTEKIGRIYAANTLGAILGVFAMVHLLVPAIGVRLSIVLAALVDGFLGAYLYYRYCQRPLKWSALGAMLATVCGFGFVEAIGRVDAGVLASGVFRYGNAQIDPMHQQTIAFVDGKTATISMTAFHNGVRNIATNGKPDAGIQMISGAPNSGDEVTMTMIASLPLSIRDRFDNVAVIGFGSGLSTHTLLASDNVGSVETIEIESQIVEIAKGFLPLNELAYTDPRSKIIINDARTHFASGKHSYDLIVSEPSNPWVSGVASLFTVEFYREVKQHLKEDGLFVQWMHAYEINDRLLGTVLAAVLSEFRFADVFVTNSTDVLIVGRQHELDFEFRNLGARKDRLASIVGVQGVSHPDAYIVRHVATTESLRAFVRIFGSEPHSDFYPVVALQGPVTRFRRDSASMLISLMDPPLPMQQLLHGRVDLADASNLDRGEHESRYFPVVRSHHRANEIIASLLHHRPTQTLISKYPEAVIATVKMIELGASCQSGTVALDLSDAMMTVAKLTVASANPKLTAQAFAAENWPGCTEPSAQTAWLELMHALAQRDAAAIEATAEHALSDIEWSRMDGREYLVGALMLGRLARGDHVGVENAEREFRVSYGRDSAMYPYRTYMLALSDEREAATH